MLRPQVRILSLRPRRNASAVTGKALFVFPVFSRIIMSIRNARPPRCFVDSKAPKATEHYNASLRIGQAVYKIHRLVAGYPVKKRVLKRRVIFKLRFVKLGAGGFVYALNHIRRNISDDNARICGSAFGRNIKKLSDLSAIREKTPPAPRSRRLPNCAALGGLCNTGGFCCGRKTPQERCAARPIRARKHGGNHGVASFWV